MFCIDAVGTELGCGTAQPPTCVPPANFFRILPSNHPFLPANASEGADTATTVTTLPLPDPGAKYATSDSIWP